MLYHWLYPLSHKAHLFNVFKYITFRSFLAFIIATLISILWGKRFIHLMKLKQFGQTIREEGPQSHKKKKGTPTFGGVFILGSAMLACAVCGNFVSFPFLIALFVTISYFFLGGLDDYLKVLKKNTKGVSARQKLLWQFLTALIASFVMIRWGITDSPLFERAGSGYWVVLCTICSHCYSWIIECLEFDRWSGWIGDWANHHLCCDLRAFVIPCRTYRAIKLPPYSLCT